MPQYSLAYGRPRLLNDGSTVLFERQTVRTAHADDEVAIHWARDEAPHLYGITEHDAAPMLLRVERPGSRTEVIWECQPKLAQALLG